MEAAAIGASELAHRYAQRVPKDICTMSGLDIFAWSMIRKSGYRFSEKIMLKQKDKAG
jgi:hypothetical protein